MQELTVSASLPTAQTSHSPLKPEPKRRITAKVRTAVDAMVWQGLNRAAAAEHAGLKDNSLYVAFAKPDVKAYYLRQLEVLRTSERARNLHRLCEIRDAANNMPAVMAIKQMEGDDHANTQTAQGVAINPGVVIYVHNTPAVMPHDRQIEAKPLIQHELGSDISRQCVPPRED